MATKRSTAKGKAAPAAVPFEEWRLENWQRVSGLSEGEATFLYIKENIPEALPGARRTLEERKRLPAFLGPQRVIIESIIDFEKVDRYAVYHLVQALIFSEALPATFTELQFLKFAIGCGITPTARGYEIARQHNLLKTPKTTNRKDAKPKKRGRPGRKPYGPQVKARDSEIYDAWKSGGTWPGIADRFHLTTREVRLAYDRERKKRRK